MTSPTRVTCYISVDDARRAIEYYTRIFGAEEVFRLEEADGRVGHAELKLGESVLMLADEFPELESVGPKRLGGTTMALHLEIPGVDDVVARAVEAGARLERGPIDELYGMRSAVIIDPFGHRWMVQTKFEDVSIDELKRRIATMT